MDGARQQRPSGGHVTESRERGVPTIGRRQEDRRAGIAVLRRRRRRRGRGQRGRRGLLDGVPRFAEVGVVEASVRRRLVRFEDGHAADRRRRRRRRRRGSERPPPPEQAEAGGRSPPPERILEEGAVVPRGVHGLREGFFFAVPAVVGDGRVDVVLLQSDQIRRRHRRHRQRRLCRIHFSSSGRRSVSASVSGGRAKDPRPSAGPAVRPLLPGRDLVEQFERQILREFPPQDAPQSRRRLLDDDALLLLLPRLRRPASYFHDEGHRRPSGGCIERRSPRERE
mmetsp:Transcript_26023/g.77019  ORF Transcript_26023/g.77019 Transcript_26023/m.77019 type:complete len:282 (+) Transcript_26023:212-1057(+)